MKRIKGFTLIELLAVIVILAVIALIATPLIMDTINEAKDSSIMRSVQNIQHAAEQHLMSKKVLNPDYTFDIKKFSYKGEQYDKMNIAFNNKEEAGVAVYKDNKCFYITAGSSNVTIDDSLDETVCLEKAGELSSVLTGVTIGEVTEQLLSDNETYTYMNGVYLKGGIDGWNNLLAFGAKYGYDETTIRNNFIKADGTFNMEVYNQVGCQILLSSGDISSLDECSTFLSDNNYENMFEYTFGNSNADAYLASKELNNNYVWYNGFIWRIMGKNEDGSIRLITNENVTAIPNVAEYSEDDYTLNYVKDWLNNYFYSRLKDTSGIVDSYFCEDVTSITTKLSARTTCSKPVKAKVGYLSLDEYNLANGSASYLVNGQWQWLSTRNSEYRYWFVRSGGLVDTIILSQAHGTRAIISVDSDMIITEGNGTLSANADTEYVLGQTLDEVNGKLKDKAGSGEYVIFDGKLYRIVEHTTNGTKLILDGFYTDNSGNYVEIAYGTEGDIFSTTGALLTGNTFLNWLAPTRSDDIIRTTWYRGKYLGDVDDKNISCVDDQTNCFESKIGLIHIGDMLASQSLSVLSKNYSVPSSYTNALAYWTLVSDINSTVWVLGSGGDIYTDYVNETWGVRPVIYISSNMNIISGNGTMSNPYEV